MTKRKRTDATRRAQDRDAKKNEKRVVLKLRKTTDRDILDLLDSLSNRTRYIKELVRRDMRDGENILIEKIQTLSDDGLLCEWYVITYRGIKYETTTFTYKRCEIATYSQLPPGVSYAVVDSDLCKSAAIFRHTYDSKEIRDALLNTDIYEK